MRLHRPVPHKARTASGDYPFNRESHSATCTSPSSARGKPLAKTAASAFARHCWRIRPLPCCTMALVPRSSDCASRLSYKSSATLRTAQATSNRHQGSCGRSTRMRNRIAKSPGALFFRAPNYPRTVNPRGRSYHGRHIRFGCKCSAGEQQPACRQGLVPPTTSRRGSHHVQSAILL